MYPSKAQNCCIIICVSINFFCKTHSIFTSVLSAVTLGKVQIAFSPVISKTSNSNFFFNTNLGGSIPFMINIPVLAELVVSIDVALNKGISISSTVAV